MKKIELQNIAHSVSIIPFLDYREYLDALFKAIKAQVGAYSFYQFAEDIGYPRSNNVREIMLRRRTLTEKGAKKICETLKIRSEQRKYLLLLVKYINERTVAGREKHLNKLLEIRSDHLDSSKDQQNLEYYSQWYHPVLREMMQLDHVETSEEGFQKRLYGRLLPQEIKESIDLLMNLGLIIKNEDAPGYQLAEKDIRPNRRTGILASIRFHQKILEIAADSITRVPDNKRDYNAITLCMDEETYLKAKKIAYEACEKIVALEGEAKSKENVYQFNTQLFPFTKDL